jgi:type VI secretion system secreted protein Hcp
MSYAWAAAMSPNPQPRRKGKSKNTSVPVPAAALAQAAAGGGLKAFLKIDGIPGESTDPKHPGEIEVDSFSWGETLPAAPGGPGGGGTVGRVQTDAFSVTMGVSIASPKLFLAAAQGTRIKQAVLSVRNDGSSDDFLIWTLSDVVVSSYRTSELSGVGRVTDTITLVFAKIQIEYHATTASGGLGPPIKACWDVASNKVC